MNRTRLAPLAAVVFEFCVLRRSGTVYRRGWTGGKEKETEKEKEKERENGKATKRQEYGAWGNEVESDVSYE